MPIINPSSGGGFPAQATQDAATLVSIISGALNGDSNAEYRFSGELNEFGLSKTLSQLLSACAIGESRVANDVRSNTNGSSFVDSYTQTYADDAEYASTNYAANSNSSSVTGLAKIETTEYVENNDVNGGMYHRLQTDTGLTKITEWFGLSNALHILEVNNDGVTETVEGVYTWTVPANTGVANATFVAANAPAAIAPTNWIAITLNGVAGYIPFFS
jgi:hypothetical protein